MTSIETDALKLEFSRALRAARAAAVAPDGTGREMTQEELAGLVGVNRSQVSNWETGKDSPPSREVVRRLEIALGVTDYDLLLNAGYHPLSWSELDIDQKAQVKVMLRQLTQESASR
jgi:transcriptional regulator with XRE-family HTH domain